MANTNNFRLVGNDTIILTLPIANGVRTMTDFFGHGEIGKITFGTDVVTVKTGKNGNAVFASNESGNQATMELRLLRGSPDDIALNTTLAMYKSDPAAFVLISGLISKRLGTGVGPSGSSSAVVISDQFALTGGVITKNVDVVSNVEGDVEQAITVWTLQFAYAARTIA
jgi:hypothetical protein